MGGERGRLTGRRARIRMLVAVALVGVVGALVQQSGAVAATSGAESGDLARYVNPFVGTEASQVGAGAGSGNTFPGADVPFGMVQWSPDTAGASYYNYASDTLDGFSLTHLSGAGCSAYQDIPMLPVAGGMGPSPAAQPGDYEPSFSHQNESAAPGYYRVTLDSGLTVELTATQRTGLARLSFPSGTGTVLVNTSGSANGVSASQVSIGADSVSGWASSGGFCGAADTYRVYFWAQFSQPFSAFGTWQGATVSPGARSAPAPGAADTACAASGGAGKASTGCGAYLSFDTAAHPTIGVRVGLSFVSVDGARANLAAEDPHGDFSQVRDAATAAWNHRLSAISVSGGSPDQLTTFYTALYHALLQPNVFSDVDGAYIGFDNRVHHVARGHAQYANFSGWDIYRSEAQLLALLAPDVASDVAQSMYQDATQGGAWARWSLANDYTGAMNGDPYQSILASVYAFGARDFDVTDALRSMVAGATNIPPANARHVERPQLAQYEQLGYVPGNASMTLEYTVADFGIAQLAADLGETSTYDTFMSRAQNWQNLYDPAEGYLQPREADGTFAEPFDAADPSLYLEGNAAQYTWLVPQNLHGLFSAMGGDAAVVRRLDTFFSQLNAGQDQPDAWLGDEPSLAVPWEYDYAGAPWRTQAVVRQAVDTLWSPSPDGMPGNDDLGEMSSWYVWAALGMYPETPGTADLALASPLFPRITVRRASGQTITIDAPGAGSGAPYVHALSVNGRPTQQTWLGGDFVAHSGSLDYTLGATPDTGWGAAPSDAPPSFSDGATPSHPYTSPARVVLAPGASATARLALWDGGAARTVSWSATPTTGFTVTPASGSLLTTGQQQLSVTAASSVPDGYYSVPISVDLGGGQVRHAALGIVVARPDDPIAVYNNTAISDDTNVAAGHFDQGGHSYSEQALAAAGVKPGSAITSGGFTFAWPDVAAGENDDIAVAGQVIKTAGVPSGATRLAFLGSAGNGNTSGTVTLTYSDGSTQSAQLGFSDWTLGGGTESPAFGNTIAVTTAYRNGPLGAQQVDTYLYATAPITLAAGKQLVSISLPSVSTGGVMHVFAFAFS